MDKVHQLSSSRVIDLLCWTRPLRFVKPPTIHLTRANALFPFQSIEIRDLNNSLTKTIKCPVQTNDIFYGGTACLLLASTAAVVLFDIQQQKVLAELATPPVKYAVWSVDGNSVALLSKHSTST